MSSKHAAAQRYPQQADVPDPAESEDYAATVPPGQWRPDVLGAGFEYTNFRVGDDDEADPQTTDTALYASLVRYRPEPSWDGAPAAEAAAPSDTVRSVPGPGVGRRIERLLDTVSDTWRSWAAGRPRATGHGARGDQEAGRAQVPATQGPPRTAVLYLHGWSDYFYNAPMAEFWDRLGARFYALDLHRYGRSLRPWQTPGYMERLEDYDADLEGALELIRREAPTERIVVVAHSTGGLIASLWAHRNPGAVHALILNSPWLEFQGSWVMRLAATGLLEPVARRRPKARVRLPEVDFYWQSLSSSGQGQWDLHPRWRPRFAFPIRAGWMAGILEGHARVAAGLDVRAPVLVLTSRRTLISTHFKPDHLEADSVLDVDLTRQRALKLGPEVTVVSVDRGMHDVFTSQEEPRRFAYDAVRRWVGGYVSGLRTTD
ncbi:alpha/beta hydrolase [Zhihengliuella sp.]|uniref:alpha/beta hydrolase n=1 Tax=Zhihengliuella sp. TaxID=1954483 RepID=UPI0028121294|nr:alpha/beta hydrolase [Zhihengliuella sp.]